MKLQNLAEVVPKILWKDGVPFPTRLLMKFKKFKGKCKLLRAIQRVMAYLETHSRGK